MMAKPTPPLPVQPSPSAPKRRRPDAILLVVLGVFLSYVVLNGVMVWMALRSDTQLVSEDYYAQSKDYDRVMAARTASDRTGWQVELIQASAREPTLQILDRNGQPVSGLSGSASAYRPSDTGLDQPLKWWEDATQPGLYHGRFTRPAPGLWQITLDLRRGGQRFYHTFRYVALQAETPSPVSGG